MPRTTLTPQIRHTLSEFPKDLDEYAPIRYFTLTDLDRQAIFNCRGDHNRLGFACQLSWLRWLGWQPNHSTGVPPQTTNFLAEQLRLPPESLSDYPSHQRLWQLHAEQVRQHLGWRAYGSAEVKELTKWLFEEALQYDNPRGLL